MIISYEQLTPCNASFIGQRAVAVRAVTEQEGGERMAERRDMGMWYGIVVQQWSTQTGGGVVVTIK